MKLKENKPTADILMMSMRSIGYSFESAIADVIDNSVSASAKEIQLYFPIDPIDCYVAICDNGLGMNRELLFDAMRYGSLSKRESRDIDDLGRFGLGLKSASLSQCRKLTVVSKQDDKLSAFIWDLDIIQREKDWFVVECTDDEIKNIKHIEYLDDKISGTVVVWEDFDLISKSSGNVYAQLKVYAESCDKYLSLIFHRFLNDKILKIQINNHLLKGLDPFLENHNKTNVRRKIDIVVMDSKGDEQVVSVQPFVLPFQKDLSAEDKKNSGGLENYRSKQGFYIYRNKRLIVWGSWFGRHRDELTKYARIKVDIPNTLDDIWSIDIKKQSAKIPPSMKNRLTKAVDDAMDIAVKAQTYRGRVVKENEDIDYIWNPIKCRGENYSYQINRNAKIFDLIKDKVDDEVWSIIDMVFEEIETNIPYQQIYIHQSQNKISDEVSDERKAEVEAKARMMLSLFLSIGNRDKNEVIEELFLSEPFVKFQDLKNLLKEEEEND